MPSLRDTISRMRHAALVGLATAALASCGAGGVRTMTFGTYSPVATRLFAAWAGSRGPLLIELRNSPYPDPPERVAEFIARAASGSYVLPGVTFTADPRKAWRPEWRIVYAFQMPPGLRMNPLCEPAEPLPAPGPGAAPGEWYTLVVFCNGVEPIRGTAAWSRPVPGPDSADFRAYASYTMFGVFPAGLDGGDNADPKLIPQ
jgi:hypothetical protein